MTLGLRCVESYHGVDLLPTWRNAVANGTSESALIFCPTPAVYSSKPLLESTKAVSYAFVLYSGRAVVAWLLMAAKATHVKDRCQAHVISQPCTPPNLPGLPVAEN